MAWFDEWDDRPEGVDIYDVLFDRESRYFDQTAWDLFEEGIIQDNPAAYAELKEYLDEYYDIDVVEDLGWQDLY